jgi:hypothetical protein
LDCLQTLPRGDALVLLLAFGSVDTWHGDLHPVSAVPCLAHTSRFDGGALPVRYNRLLARLIIAKLWRSIGLLSLPIRT